jgi:hypothetical protein
MQRRDVLVRNEYEVTRTTDAAGLDCSDISTQMTRVLNSINVITTSFFADKLQERDVSHKFLRWLPINKAQMGKKDIDGVCYMRVVRHSTDQGRWLVQTCVAAWIGECQRMSRNFVER